MYPQNMYPQAPMNYYGPNPGYPNPYPPPPQQYQAPGPGYPPSSQQGNTERI